MELVPIESQYIIMITCCSLSVIGSAFIIVFSFYKTQSQTFYSKIVLFISVSDIVRSALFMVPCNSLNNKFAINLIGILIGSSFLITIIWSTYISIVLYSVVVKNQIKYDVNYKYWFIISFVVVPILNTLPCITDSHGVSSTICTFKSDQNGQIWRFCIYYCPAWILVLISLFSCIRIYHEIKKLKLDNIQKYLVKKLIFYPVVFIIEFLPLTITAILNFAKILNVNSIITVTTLSIYTLHGASNSIIYAFNLEKHRNEKASVIKGIGIVTAKIDTSDFSSENLLFKTFSVKVSDHESREII